MKLFRTFKQPTDRTAINKALNNNTDIKQERFMALYEPIHKRLNRFVQTLLWNEEDAKDVVSETVLIAFEKLDTLKDDEAFLSYLFSIASNLVNQRLRRKKFWGWFSNEAAHEIPDNTSSESRLLLYELNRALNKLPHKQREAVVWYEVSGLSMEQIAELHGTGVSGVKSNLHRARKALALLLEKEENNITQLKGVWYE